MGIRPTQQMHFNKLTLALYKMCEGMATARNFALVKSGRARLAQFFVNGSLVDLNDRLQKQA